MLRPRRHHHFDSVNVGSPQILMEAPTAGPIAKVNKANLTKQPNKLRTSASIDFELVTNGDRSVVRHWDRQQFMGQARNRCVRKIHLADNIDLYPAPYQS